VDEAAGPARQTQDSTMARVLGADFSKLSAVEVGARRGIGPLSPLGKIVWHGEARPCVSCGHLIRRTAARCQHCGQLLTGDMIQKMRKYSGPWYVLEHVRPFPGVSKERLILQARRGVLTHATIVRGPSTHHQWRFAAETPALSKYLGVCWACQATVHEDDTTCPVCRKNLDSDGEEVLIEGDETLEPPAQELDELQAAVRSIVPRPRPADEPARIGRVPVRWVVAALVIVLMAVVYLVAAHENRRGRSGGKAAQPVPLVLPEAAGAKPGAVPEARGSDDSPEPSG
jgi:RNA polymerase subunit RPABC4/transcription elongation factor Spt4